MPKALDLSKLLKKLSMKGSGTSWSRGGVSRVNRLRGIWGWLWFSSGVAHRVGGVWLAVFRGCFANIGEIFILAGGLGAGLSFYVV